MYLNMPRKKGNKCQSFAKKKSVTVIDQHFISKSARWTNDILKDRLEDRFEIKLARSVWIGQHVSDVLRCIKYGGNLAKIDLCECKLDSTAIELIAKELNDLKKIKLVSLGVVGNDVNHKSAEAIGQLLRGRGVAQLSLPHRMPETCLSSILEQLTKVPLGKEVLEFDARLNPLDTRSIHLFENLIVERKITGILDLSGCYRLINGYECEIRGEDVVVLECALQQNKDMKVIWFNHSSHNPFAKDAQIHQHKIFPQMTSPKKIVPNANLEGLISNGSLRMNNVNNERLPAVQKMILGKSHAHLPTPSLPDKPKWKLNSFFTNIKTNIKEKGGQFFNDVKKKLKRKSNEEESQPRTKKMKTEAEACTRPEMDQVVNQLGDLLRRFTNFRGSGVNEFEHSNIDMRGSVFNLTHVQGANGARFASPDIHASGQAEVSATSSGYRH